MSDLDLQEGDIQALYVSHRIVVSAIPRIGGPRAVELGKSMADGRISKLEGESWGGKSHAPCLRGNLGA